VDPCESTARVRRVGPALRPACQLPGVRDQATEEECQEDPRPVGASVLGPERRRWRQPQEQQAGRCAGRGNARNARRGQLLLVRVLQLEFGVC